VLDGPGSDSGDRHVPPRSVPAQLPAPPAVFIARGDELAEVLGTAATPVVVHGPAGVGKTTFALHAVHLLAPRFQDGQLFADLHGFGPSDAAFDSSAVLAQFLDALGVRANALPGILAARAALYCRSPSCERLQNDDAPCLSAAVRR